jgi:hypothetical protein
VCLALKSPWVESYEDYFFGMRLQLRRYHIQYGGFPIAPWSIDGDDYTASVASFYYDFGNALGELPSSKSVLLGRVDRAISLKWLALLVLEGLIHALSSWRVLQVPIMTIFLRKKSFVYIS